MMPCLVKFLVLILFKFEEINMVVLSILVISILRNGGEVIEESDSDVGHDEVSASEVERSDQLTG